MASSLSAFGQRWTNETFGQIVTIVTDPIDTFTEMWYQIFLWALCSSMFVHLIAALVGFCALRRHKIGRLYPLALLLVGLIASVTGGSITSAVIAWCYFNSTNNMPTYYAIVVGLGQTIICVTVSFAKIMATL